MGTSPPAKTRPVTSGPAITTATSVPARPPAPPKPPARRTAPPPAPGRNPSVTLNSTAGGRSMTAGRSVVGATRPVTGTTASAGRTTTGSVGSAGRTSIAGRTSTNTTTAAAAGRSFAGRTNTSSGGRIAGRGTASRPRPSAPLGARLPAAAPAASATTTGGGYYGAGANRSTHLGSSGVGGANPYASGGSAAPAATSSSSDWFSQPSSSSTTISQQPQQSTSGTSSVNQWQQPTATATSNNNINNNNNINQWTQPSPMEPVTANQWQQPSQQQQPTVAQNLGSNFFLDGAMSQNNSNDSLTNAGGSGKNSMTKPYSTNSMEYPDFENEPPLLEEIGVNIPHIWTKTKAVILPFQKLHGQTIHLDPAIIVEDADLAGPLMFALALGGELLMTGKLHFGFIYGIGLTGCLSMTLLLNLMSPKDAISVWTVTSILGYGLLPVNVLAAVKILLVNLFGLVTFGRILALVAILWSTVASTRLLEVGCGMRSQRYLIGYPIALLYSAFVLMTIF